MNTTQNTQTQVSRVQNTTQNDQNVELIYSGFLRRIIEVQLDVEEQLKEVENRDYLYDDILQGLFWGLREKINETMDSAIEEQLRNSRK